MAGDACQEVHDLDVVLPGEEGMVPLVYHMGFGDGFDVAEVHQHAVAGGAIVPYHVASQSDFKHVAMTVQMPALAAMVGDAMAGIEFKAAGNLHGAGCYAWTAHYSCPRFSPLSGCSSP